MPTVKKSLTLDEDVVETVDRLRIQKRPIKSFSSMTCELVRRGASGYKIPIKQKVSERELESDFEDEEQEVAELVEDAYQDITKSRKRREKSKKYKGRVDTKIVAHFCFGCGTSLPRGEIVYCDLCGRKLI